MYLTFKNVIYTGLFDLRVHLTIDKALSFRIWKTIRYHKKPTDFSEESQR